MKIIKTIFKRVITVVTLIYGGGFLLAWTRRGYKEAIMDYLPSKAKDIELVYAFLVVIILVVFWSWLFDWFEKIAYEETEHEDN